MEAPSISLPKGGGALRSIDEQFSVNACNGTASLSLPLPFSPARGGQVPPVRIGYDVGTGNSVVGLGWSLDIPSVRRRTDRHIPTYDDGDAFSLAGGDDLVPVLEWNGAAWVEPPPPAGPDRVRRFRPRIERELARIEQIASPDVGTWWRVTSRDNVTTVLGYDDQHRLADPEHGDRVLEWLPSFSFDDRGNVVVFDFVPEDLGGVAESLAEANRHGGIAPFTNLHLKRVHYGNRTPYAPNPAQPYRPPPPDQDFLFEAVLDYGEHDVADPTPDPSPGDTWPARDDPFSTRRGGFEVRTYRLLRRVLMFHRLDDLDGGAPTLVRSLDLTHQSVGECTHLVSAVQRGYLRRPDGTLAVQSQPALELSYEPVAWDDQVHLVDPESVSGLPAGIGTGYQWMDLAGEGISGVFTEQAGAWWFKRNLGVQGDTGQVRLDRARLVAPKPSPTGMTTGSLQLQDLDADGRRQVVVRTPELQGYYERDDDASWRPFESFQETLRIDLQDRHTRMLDVVGDGRSHLLVTEQDALVWSRSLGTRGHEHGGRVAVGSDEERGPAVVFADETQSVFLADMTGDGLVDIVRVRNRDICYWPNLGYGRFGARIAMDGAPHLGHDDLFDTAQLRLTDITATGTADLVHIGRDGCTVYLNLAGNGWDAGHAVAAPFPSGNGIEMSVTDLLGTGTTCLVWSSSLPDHADAPMRYVDVTGGRKPHLLRSYVTNLGKEVELTHRSSTWHYLQAEREGRPWRTRLPFPVHCLSRVETRDRVRGARLVTDYRYHHGHFDSVERELRGFGMVEQLDAEQFEHWAVDGGATLEDRSLHPPPTLTRTWFHTGALLPEHGPAAPRRDEHWDAEMRRHGFEVDGDEPPLPETSILTAPGGASVDRREAVRACKGAVLRTEVFALDAPGVDPTDDELRRQLSPFSVAERTSVVRVVQPGIGERPGVLAVFESESITRAYERTLDDPRVDHVLNVRLDDLGNVVESATLAYGRQAADPSLPAAVQDLQAKTRVSYVHQEHTGDVVTALDHRLRLPSRRNAYELRGLQPAGPIFTIGDFDRDGFHALTDSLDEPDPDVVPPQGTVLRRRLASSQTIYYDATLSAPLALHGLAARALPFESYELTLTAAMTADVYDGRVDDAMLLAGGYVHRGDVDWWTPSGRHEYLLPGDDVDDARARFFTAVGHVDGRGTRTLVRHHGDTWLLASEVEDAAGNQTTVSELDWRALAPTRVVDPNGNLTEVLLDELGRVKAAAHLGKGEGDSLAGLTGWTSPQEAATVAAFLAADTSTDLADLGASLLGPASARYVYDLHGYAASGGTAPASVATITREQYAAVQPDSPVQIGLEYSNGRGEVELHKAQAEPGVARRVTVQPDDTVVVEDVDTAALAPPQLRWLGNGRKVVNDKGQTVKEYEPFFSVTHRFESAKELVESGVAILRTHDPLGRPVRADHPDGTYTRLEPGAWRTVEHDRNDTVTTSEWYRWRVDRLIDADLLAAGRDPVREEQAALQTEAHDATPFSRHLDPHGRPVLELQHSGPDAQGDPVLLPTIYTRDIEGRARTIVDARGIETITYRYDLRGALVSFTSADGGTRWMLADVRGEPLRSWDERGHEYVCEYDDPLRRLSAKRVRGGDGAAPLDHVVERRVYGDGLPGAAAANLRTRIATLYDTAGRVQNQAYDLAGNLVSGSRRFRSDYRTEPDWSGPLVGLDAALEPADHASAAVYDGLGRVAERTTADGSVYQPGYNAANLLETVTVTQHAGPEVHVKGIDYDERGRRRGITYGNDVTAAYEYDRETGRLLRLTIRDPDGVALQDLHYTYDPVGNVTHLDDACVPRVWFDNHMVDGLSRYTYDPLYRLVEATGREHVAQVDFGTGDNWADLAFRQSLDPSDALAWRTYTQAFSYDRVSNIDQVVHSAGAGSWTRTYDYAPTSNRLLSTQVGATTFSYQHHPAHGLMTDMPHLTVMRWNFRDELQAVATQEVASGTPETTWYVYDGEGKRVRKVTDRAAAPDAEPVKRAGRYYLDGVEIAFEHDGVGNPVVERRTLHVMDDHARVALVEDERDPGAVVPSSRRVRYQAPDHLGSAHVETDEAGAVIAYEVFHPFGTTAYEATATNLGPGARRYRYTGMERDDESGLGYHGARFYAPWLGRWTAPDEHADQLDGNRYAYVKNNPLAYRDPNGLFEEPVHGALTYRLAIAAGFSQSEAAEIAIATAGMDHEAQYRPGDDLGEMQKQILMGRTQRYHYPTQERALEQIEEDISLGVPDLREFGRHLHSLEDVGFRDAPGPHNRSSVRLLGPTVAVVGLLAAGVGVLAALGADAAFSAGGAWSALGALAVVVAVAAFALALYAIVFAIVGRDTGHPTYLTEDRRIDGSPKPRLLSAFWSHAADRAFEDPHANTKELRRIYEVLKRAARASNPNAVSDDPGAEAAIRQAVEADTSDRINALFGDKVRDPSGVLQPSYADIRRAAPWAHRPPDVSLSRGKVVWQPGVWP